MTKISVVINTLNEEKNVGRAITSVVSLSDEIIVVDMKSTDRTRDIAKKLGARVFEHERTGYVEPARNFALRLAKGDWILVLDADEEVSNSLKKELKSIVRDPKFDYFRLPRKNIIFGKWIKHSRWWPDYNIRFFKKGSVSWDEVIHSVPMTVGDGHDLLASEENAIIHYHYQSVEQYLDRMNRYSSHYAKNIIDKGYQFNWVDLIKKPCDEFLSRFFMGEGYKDGLHGFALAGLQAFSEFVVYLKVWQMGEFKTKDYSTPKLLTNISDSIKDFNYWKADYKVKNDGGLVEKVKRKFKLP